MPLGLGVVAPEMICTAKDKYHDFVGKLFRRNGISLLARMNGGYMKGFLVGLGTGAALGLLFAPRRGDETRQQWRSKAGDFMDAANEQTDKVKSVATKIQEQVANLRQPKREAEAS